MTRLWFLRPIVAALPLLAVAGCASGMPLGHPAHPLENGSVRLGGGLSATFATGALSDAIATDATDATQGATSAAVRALVGPGMAPYAGARMGLSHGWEGGVAYAGRMARIDMRRPFVMGPWAVSIGAGASGVVGWSDGSKSVTGAKVEKLRGYGMDVPVLFGWRSKPDLYHLWLGTRAGYERYSGDVVYGDGQLPPSTMTASRTYVAATVGMALGLRRLHFVFEFEARQQWLWADVAPGSTLRLSGLSLTPASSVAWAF